MSQQIQGRVIDSSVYGWLADVAVSLSAAGYATTTYVDGSLALRDASLQAYGTDLELKADLTYVDGSLSLRDASLQSYGTLIDNIETSIGVLDTLTVNLEASVGTLDTLTQNLDSSVTWLYENVEPADLAYIDGSLAERDVSIAWLADNKENKVDVDSSFGLYETKTNLDTSFGLYDTKLEIDSSFGLYHTKTYIDGSLNLKANLNTDISTNSDSYVVTSVWNNDILEFDASATVTLPDSLDAGFQITIVNISSADYLTLEASTLLTKDSSTMVEFGDGISAYHKGSGTWRVLGPVKNV